MKEAISCLLTALVGGLLVYGYMGQRERAIATSCTAPREVANVPGLIINPVLGPYGYSYIASQMIRQQAPLPQQPKQMQPRKGK